MLMRFAYSAESDLGHVRDNNEDSAFAAQHLLLVADGVGGQAAGEVASASVAFVVSTISLRAITSPSDPVDLLVVLRETIERAFRTLSDGVEKDNARSGMATTLTSILTDGTRFALAHIGDSRAYLVRDGGLTQLTTDHTYVQVLLDKGSITPEEAKTHPHRSVVTRYVNATDQHEPQLRMLDLRAGDRLLLCSDGLTDFVPDEQVASDLCSTPPAARSLSSADSAAGEPSEVWGTSPDEGVKRLIASALATGGRDNITCVVADIEPREPEVRNRPPALRLGALADSANVIDLATAERAG
jgi:PPM family protein phosphatase